MDKNSNMDVTPHSAPMDIFPVIVIYKCSIYKSRAYSSLIKGKVSGSFMIYDNSPSSFIQSENPPTNAIYIRDTNNKGLAEAYNAAAAEAGRLGYTHILLLDQDTLFPENSWHEYEKAEHYNGIIAPQLATDDGKPFSPVDISGWSPKGTRLNAGEHSLYKYNVVNSGICIPIRLFLNAGGYDPATPLDFADFQFNRRIRKLRSSFMLLPFTALQDFSDNCTDPVKLLSRFRLYASSAKGFITEGITDALKHHFSVLKHTIALTIRTRNMAFAREYISIFLLPNLRRFHINKKRRICSPES